MPSEIGGKRFASQFRTMIQDEVGKAFEVGRQRIRDATADLTAAIHEQSSAAARVIREEAAHIRTELGEYTGNAEPDEEQKEPPRTPVAVDPVKAAADRAEAAAAAAQALPIVSPVAEQQAEPEAPAAPRQPALEAAPPGMPSGVPDWQKQ